jgi:hypothetical protein
MTIPRVDCYLASLASSYIVHVNRSSSDHQFASFFDITPETRDSTKIKRGGRILRDSEMYDHL